MTSPILKSPSHHLLSPIGRLLDQVKSFDTRTPIKISSKLKNSSTPKACAQTPGRAPFTPIKNLVPKKIDFLQEINEQNFQDVMDACFLKSKVTIIRQNCVKIDLSQISNWINPIRNTILTLQKDQNDPHLPYFYSLKKLADINPMNSQVIFTFITKIRDVLATKFPSVKITQLDLSSNSEISSLATTISFVKANLPHLKKLVLDNCDLINIQGLTKSKLSLKTISIKGTPLVNEIIERNALENFLPDVKIIPQNS